MIVLEDDNLDDGWIRNVIENIEQLITGFKEEPQVEKLKKAIDTLLEDPSLIDSRLSNWLAILGVLTSEALLNDNVELLEQSLEIYNQFCKLRGFNIIRIHTYNILNLTQIMVCV